MPSTSMDLFQVFSILIALAAIFSFINFRYLHMPTTIGVMLIATLVSLALVVLGKFGFTAHAHEIQMLRGIDFQGLLLNGMLAFLLFAGALPIDTSELVSQWQPVALLALVGTLISAAVIATLLWLLGRALSTHLAFGYCMLFGALISPTDPIAVLGIMRGVGAPKNLEVQIAGESLFNDGVGIVMFVAVLEWMANPHSLTPGHITLMILQQVAGGAGLGLVLGYLTFQLIRRVDHYQVEVLLTLALAMGSYAAAEAVHVSAPIAVVIAGLLMGNRGRHLGMSDKTREHLDTFWELLDEIFNACLFLLLGLELLVIPVLSRHLWLGVIAVPVTIFARWLAVAGLMRLLGLWRPILPGSVRILTWGGLRGGISVALALSLPDGPQRTALLTITYCVVVFSVIVQGLTISTVIRKSTAGPTDRGTPDVQTSEHPAT